MNIIILNIDTVASHRLQYVFEDIDFKCMDKAGLRLDLQGVCFDGAIYRMEQKIIKSGKMNKAQITHYLRPYKERCIKQAIKDGMIENRHYDEYGSYYVDGCLSFKSNKYYHFSCGISATYSSLS